MNTQLTNSLSLPVKPSAATPGTFASVRQSMIRRDHACIHSAGGYFEYLL